MKRLFLISITIILLGLTFSAIKLNAQCDVGFTPMNITMMVGDNPPCPYDVELCVKCPTGPAPGEVYVKGFMPKNTTPPCNNGLTIQEVTDYINSQVSTFDFIQTYLCTELDNAPPCPQQSMAFTFHHWLCWQIEIIEYFGEERTHYHPCNYEDECEATYTYCWDSKNQEYDRTIVSLNQTGPSCTKEALDLTYIPQQLGDPPSDCYISHTTCNPLP